MDQAEGRLESELAAQWFRRFLGNLTSCCELPTHLSTNLRGTKVRLEGAAAGEMINTRLSRWI